MDYLKRVVVFIASPGDVAKERDRVRYAIGRINSLVAKPKGFFLEGIGWEDIPQGMAERAQDLINPYVDNCHIFIGILNRKFGRPNGLAESGTEEEFDRIEGRWEKENPKPQVLIYFKKVPTDDPGEQLKKVLAFKSRIRSTALYKEFEDDLVVLQESVENSLANWVHNHDPSLVPSPETPSTSLDEADEDILALLSTGALTTRELASRLNLSIDETRNRVAKLQEKGWLKIQE